MSNDDREPKKPRPLGEDALSRIHGGVGPLLPEELAQARQRIVIDLGAPSKPKHAPRKSRG